MTSPDAPRMLTRDTPLTELTGDQLRARVARAQMFLIDVAPTDNAPSVLPAALERDHLAYLYKLEVEGRLYGYGPIDAQPGRLAHHLAIVVAATLADAQAIAASEPLQRAGLATNTVRGHWINEGVACYVARAMSRRAAAIAPFDPNISSVGTSAADISGRAMGAAVQLVTLEPTDKPRPKEDEQTGYDHFVWLREHEMKAQMMSCGPLEPAAPLAPGIWGGGLGIFATTRAEAERIASIEPSGRAGYRRLTVQTWVVDYGVAAPIARALATLNTLP